MPGRPSTEASFEWNERVRQHLGPQVVSLGMLNLTSRTPLGERSGL